jgi:hypothetical protein
MSTFIAGFFIGSTAGMFFGLFWAGAMRERYEPENLAHEGYREADYALSDNHVSAIADMAARYKAQCEREADQEGV